MRLRPSGARPAVVELDLFLFLQGITTLISIGLHSLKKGPSLPTNLEAFVIVLMVAILTGVRWELQWLEVPFP